MFQLYLCLTCLFRLGLCFLIFLTMLGCQIYCLKYFSTILFLSQGLGCVCVCMFLACAHRLDVCVRIQLACVCRPMYVHAYSCPETLILSFLFHLLCLFHIISSVLTFLYAFCVYVFLFTCLFFFNILDQDFFYFLVLIPRTCIHMYMHECHRC